MSDTGKHAQHFWLAALILLLALLTTACAVKTSQAQDATVTANVEGAQTATSEPTSTPQVSIEATPDIIATPLLSETPTVVLQPTEAISLEVTSTLSTTAPLPQPSVVISFDNVSQLREVAQFGQGHTWEVRLSTNGDLVFVASGIGIKLYDATSREVKASLPVLADCEMEISGEIHSIVSAADGQKVLACSGKELQAYSLDGKLLWAYPLPESKIKISGKPTPAKVVVSPDLNYLVLPSTESTQDLDVWDPAGNKLLQTIRGINPLFTADSSHLGVDYNGNVWLYNTQDWSKQESIGIHQGWDKLFLPDGDHLAILQPDRIEIYRLSNKKLERIFFEYSAATHPGLFVSPDGQKIAWTGREYPDKPMKVWNIADGKQVGTFWRTNSIWSAWPQEFTRLTNEGRVMVNEFAEALDEKKDEALLPAGYLGCILKNGSEAPCSLPAGENYYDLTGQIFSLIQTTPTEPYRVFTGPEGSGNLLGAVTLEKTRQYTPLTLSPNQKYLLIASYPDERTVTYGSYRLELWELKTGTRLGNWSGRLENVAFSQDGRFTAILLGKYVGKNINRLVLFVYDFTGRAIVYQQDIAASTGYEPTGLAFIPQGELVYTSETTRSGQELVLIKFLDTEKWQPWREISISDFGTLRTKSANHAPVLAVSPDGKLLAVALADQRVRLYDLSNGNELYTWTPHQSQTSAIQFSTDGRLLGTLSSQDGITKFWAVMP